MALSNWTTVAWNENGDPCEGKIEANEVIVEIYKNWLYVRDEKAWRESSGYMRPVVMKVLCGQLEYCGLKIIASRGRNDELFVVIEYDNNDYTERRQLIGIACYGYDDEEYVGVTEGTKKEFLDWIEKSRDDWPPGVYIHSDTIDKIKGNDQHKEFNQGDAFLVKELGLGDVPVNTDEPLLNKALKTIGDKK